MRTSTTAPFPQGGSKLQRQIQNTNRQIIKNYEHKHSAVAKIQTILGIEHQPFHQSVQSSIISNNQRTTSLISLNEEEILYYSCKYFVVYNIGTKDYQIITKDVKNCTLVQMKKFNTTDPERKLIVCIYQTQHTKQTTYLGLLTIRTDYESRSSRNDSRFQWKVIKFHAQPINLQDYSLYSKKNLLYFIVTKPSLISSDSKPLFYNPLNSEHQKQSQKPQQYLWVYDLNKQLMLLNHEIRSNTVGFFIQYLSLEDPNLVYFVGRNYFRQWTINFNEKSIKESNVRNVERVIKNKIIVDFQQVDKYSLRQDVDHISQIPFLNPHLQHNNFHILTQPSKLLIILTSSELIFVKNNELICAFNPQQIVSKQSRNKDNIEKELENSFNQIHKMKFLFDEYEELKEKQERKLMNASDEIKQYTERDLFTNFTCISKSWKAQNQNHYFALANSSHNVLVYELVDYQLKLYNQFTCEVSSTLNSIVPTQGGDLLLCLNQDNEVHLINQENYDPEDDLPIKSLWGNGQMHAGKIFTISSPVIQNIMCTVGEDGSFKLWSMKKNERSIIFQSKPASKPLGITIHPGGTMIGVNFEREIKLFSILPKEFYQITSIKTNYCSLQLRYSERGEFLVSNEGSVLIFYEPFSLKTLGYIEPADLKCRIVDFKLSKNAGFVCFVAEDNSCYLQSITIGEMSRWQHFSPVHKQSEPYTAFCFDFIEKQTMDERREKQVMDEKKLSNIFIGATRNKYMVLYENLGSKLLAEFPIIDCYIVDMEIYDNLLFVATSKGTLRVYNWPILQQDLELQIVNLDQNQIRYKPPRYEEYQVWHQSIPITKLHRLRFSSQLIITNSRGNMCVMSFQETKNKKILYEEVSSDRKKMEQLINQMFYIKKSQTEKRNKLIEKTENDILKVENEIAREKVTLERKMCQEQHMVQKGYEMKSLMQEQEKEEFLSKEYEQIALLKKEIQQKQTHLEEIKAYILKDYESKKMYEQSRNQEVEEEIRTIIQEHKEKIRRKIQTHKEEIRNKKKEYFSKVKQVQTEFEEELINIYEAKLKEMSQEPEEKVQMAFGYEKASKNTAKKGDEKESKARSTSTQLIANILNENTVTTENVLQTENEHLKSFINKLQSIEMNGSPTINLPIQHTFSTQIISSNNMPSQEHQTLTVSSKPPTTHLSSINQSSLPINNLISQPANNPSSQLLQPNQSKKLKRTGMYQLNERNFLRKKEQQQLANKEQELSLKYQNQHSFVETEFNNQLMQELNSKQNEDIMIQVERVSELKQSNQLLQKQIMSLKQKVENMESEDQSMQKEFQKNLQEYNLNRFQNLNLHCEVLKMQNQLIQRKQVLQNKEEIVMLAYQQKQKLQNYKELVKGSLAKLQEKKQNMRETFFKKEADLNSIFSELVNEIHKMEEKKAVLQKLERKCKQTAKEHKIKEANLNEVISKLKEIKKYLLLQRMNDQKSQKSIYQHEQQLLQTINFLKKRLYMESIKEKKNKQLKKSNLNQILKQNKNLLQECNQLRSQGIEYENEIRNLSNKLKQANKMISIETKLKSQKHEVNEQKNQLGIIKNLFQMQLKEFEDHDGATFNTPDDQHEQEAEDIEHEGQDNETVSKNKVVYFDSEKSRISHNSRSQVVFTNITNAFTSSKQKVSKQNAEHKLHKPFVLSKYIEAEPFENIEV